MSSAPAPETNPTARPVLTGMPRAALRRWAETELGQPAYRGEQIFEWIHRHRVLDPDAMTSLPKALRARLRERARFDVPALEHRALSRDGTAKYLFRLEDGRAIEAVMIPDGARRTLCISTQVGCALACTFCATGKLGFQRNLAPHEIVGQFLAVERDLSPPGPPGERSEPRRGRLTHLVLMGMGEPLLNAQATIEALEVLTDPRGAALPRRRITLSTVGISHRLWSFLERTGVRLALSLHAPSPDLRARIMPVERANPMRDLLAEIRRRQGQGALRDRVTFEYVLLAGVNDQPEHARALARTLEGIHGKVNLLPFNPYPGAPFDRPDDAAVERFRSELVAAGLDAYIRRSRGRDIAAACGQLALRPTEASPVASLPRR